MNISPQTTTSESDLATLFEMTANHVEEGRREIVSPFEVRDITEDGDGLTLEGYAAVFNSPTTITDWEGTYVEEIEQGAFRRSLQAQRPVLQFDHGTHPVIGSMPIGSLRKTVEDKHGLFIQARLFNNWMTEPLRDAIADEAIEGMSFRFQVLRDSWTKNTKGERFRTLQEVKLFELGPVVFPAYADTTVALRSLQRLIPIIDLGTSTGPADSTPTEPATGSNPDSLHLLRTKNQRRALVALALTKG